MKLYYDFHIHTGFSPCGSEDMSPNNIVNMSIIKGLDAIAITDHNGIGNVRVTVEVGEKLGLIVIPGMEIQTVEDVHMVVLFRDIIALENFYQGIKDKRLMIKNKPERFGEQVIFNDQDEIVGYEDNYLITPYSLTINEIIKTVQSLDGVVFPAHINRNSFSIIKSLGFIDKDMAIENIEWYGKRPDDAEDIEKRMFRKYRELINSDAHDLISISERENYLEVEEKSIQGIFKVLTQSV
ncbi:PHP domain-containing protein [Acidaminobacter sp. JC074]|uniref:PHP domain-containing protein n=1 Tax=Acidaminobacter sp. JC074 TaxID=2530199 RepID=UPI001F0D385B|nr:PHP domain-containing protein [Acidaminobacter sp. JC074]MCH4889039.1 PHP domain-containing protein [Acidaminobacter sp. JC074]